MDMVLEPNYIKVLCGLVSDDSKELMTRFHAALMLATILNGTQQAL